MTLPGGDSLTRRAGTRRAGDAGRTPRLPDHVLRRRGAGDEGQGYIDDLLAAGTATLLSGRKKGGNEKLLRADTDVVNTPMAAAFRRAGWVEFASRREFVVDPIADRA